MKILSSITLLLLLLNTSILYGQEDEDLGHLDLVDPEDAKLLEDVESPVDSKRDQLKSVKLTVSEKEEIDDLESLKDDLSDIYFSEEEKKSPKKKVLEMVKEQKEKTKSQKSALKGMKDKGKTSEKVASVFDVGEEEKKLLKISRLLVKKIPRKEWDELAKATKVQKYTVVEGENLWNISKNFFGSGFYYAKIWSMNPYIRNPHQIEPGMQLVFHTGNIHTPPELKVGSFSDEEEGLDGETIDKYAPIPGKFSVNYLKRFGEFGVPPWIVERNKLIDQGLYIQYASDHTYDDLAKLGKKGLNNEYQKYRPDEFILKLEESAKQYDSTGFDKSSKIDFKFKEGFHLTTFVSSNIVQDFGKIVSARRESIHLAKYDTVYVQFDPKVNVRAGDRYSIYAGEGKLSYKKSDRYGYRYTINGHISVKKQVDKNRWECHIDDSPGLIRRGDRVTVYTPQIEKIITTFNQRVVEAIIIGSYSDLKVRYSYGDIIYLDRGRADGLEMGNVFNVLSFKDRLTDERISEEPTYKVGEVTVITLTDNFATGLVSSSKVDFGNGTLLRTKTLQDAARSSRVNKKLALERVKKLEDQVLDKLDVELNVDDLTDDLLEKADSIELSEDELEELEKQERERSIIRDKQKDLKALELLEKEIEDVEAKLDESKLDEDKLLEMESLNKIEKGTKGLHPDAFADLSEIENEVGKKYIEGDLNSKDNPYGLTEFDIEEIDDLLNTEEMSKN